MFFWNRKKKVEKNVIDIYQKSLNLLYEKIDPKDLPGFVEYRGINEIGFRSPVIKNMSRAVPLESLKKASSYSNGDILWEASYSEYVSVYSGDDDDEILQAIKEHLNPALLLLKEFFNNEYYQFTISKYEISIGMVYETLKESMEFNNEIPNKLKEETLKILLKFSSSIEKCEAERKKHIERDCSSFNKSLIERIKLEDEYIKKFVE